MGRRKAHTDKNVVIVDLTKEMHRLLEPDLCLARRMTRRLPIAEGISYPPKAELYKDTGFQEYEPAVNEDLPGKKKAAPRETHSR